MLTRVRPNFIMFCFSETSDRNVLNQSSDKDFSPQYYGLSPKMMQDIYNVHRHFKFAYFHFEEYNINHYKEDIKKSGNKYKDSIGKDLADKHLHM